MKIGSLELFEDSALLQLGIITDHGLPIGQGPNVPLLWTAAPTNGQVLVGVTGSDPVLTTLTAGAGITISNGPGSITIGATLPVVVTWKIIMASQTLASNFGYLCTGGGNLLLTLPAAGALGDIIEVVLDGSTSWTLLTQPGQTVRYGNLLAATSIASTNQGDTVRMVCQSAARWNILSSLGNLTTT